MAGTHRGTPGAPPAWPAAALAAIDPALRLVEQEVARLGLALRQQDGSAIDRQAPVLQQALAEVVKAFGRAGGQGGPGDLPPELWQRLNAVSRQVAEQRQTVLRNSLGVDRAVAQLMPAGAAPANASTPSSGRSALAAAYRA